MPPIFPRQALRKIYVNKNIYIYVFGFFVTDFPATSPPKNICFKKMELIFLQFFCRRFSGDQPSKKYMFLKIYVFFQFFLPPIFQRPGLHVLCKYFFFHFFRRRFSRDEPFKKISFKKIKHIFFSFLSPIFHRPALQKIYVLKNSTYIIVDFLCRGFSIDQPFKKTILKKNPRFSRDQKIKIIVSSSFLSPIFPRPALKKISVLNK